MGNKNMNINEVVRKALENKGINLKLIRSERLLKKNGKIKITKNKKQVRM